MSWQFRGRPAIVEDIIAARRTQLAAPAPDLAATPPPAPVSPHNAAVDERPHGALRTELERRSLRDGLERCGCWPRYTGGCYCPPGGAS